MSLSHARPPRQDPWTTRSKPLDPMVRRMTYGKVRPMEEDTPFAFFQRWFRRV